MQYLIRHLRPRLFVLHHISVVFDLVDRDGGGTVTKRELGELVSGDGAMTPRSRRKSTTPALYEPLVPLAHHSCTALSFQAYHKIVRLRSTAVVLCTEAAFHGAVDRYASRGVMEDITQGFSCPMVSPKWGCGKNVKESPCRDYPSVFGMLSILPRNQESKNPRGAGISSYATWFCFTAKTRVILNLVLE